jgi:hypothetical protein
VSSWPARGRLPQGQQAHDCHRWLGVVYVGTGQQFHGGCRRGRLPARRHDRQRLAEQSRCGEQHYHCQFVASTSINLTAGTGHDIVTTLKGTNTFASAAPGTLTVTGGVGADAYRLGEFSQGLTVNDFSLAKGDTLTVDNYFKGHSIKSTTDRAGGTFFSRRPSSLRPSGPEGRNRRD